MFEYRSLWHNTAVSFSSAQDHANITQGLQVRNMNNEYLQNPKPVSKTTYRTIVLSDIHLGTSASKAKEVCKFLSNHKCETLILNGDIIDGWQLRKSGVWKKKHTRFFRMVLKRAGKGTRVIYIRGNHDDFLDEVLPFKLGNFSIQRDYIHESNGKRYFVVHGDIFDTVTTKLKWIAKLGDVSYTFLLWVNKHYNRWRERRGKPYYSLSQVIKAKVKGAVSFISDFEEQLSAVAKIKHCDGVICGHIHTPADKYIGDIHYLNSGDWVESLTALAETEDGEWKLIYYTDWLKSTQEYIPEQLPPQIIPSLQTA